jgi:hypothetical protein
MLKLFASETGVAPATDGAPADEEFASVAGWPDAAV